MQKLLGKINGPKNIRHTPTIAVIGSGGGFRAMTGTGIHGLVPFPIKQSDDLSKGMAGAMKALQSTGILDCCTYSVGLSGTGSFA